MRMRGARRLCSSCFCSGPFMSCRRAREGWGEHALIPKYKSLGRSAQSSETAHPLYSRAVRQPAAPHPPTRCLPLVLKLIAAPIPPMTHARDAVYQYLTAVFELVAWWAQEGRAVGRAHRALHLRGHNSVREPEPFAAVILCTADRGKVDDRTRSKWSRVLRYAAEYKDLAEPLRDFIKRKGGINKCAARFARCLGRGSQR